MTSKRVLVAGCGYVGEALARELAAAGHAVAGLRRRADLVPAGVEPLACDLGDAAALAACLRARRFDWVVYCAAADGRDLGAYRRAYVEGLAHLVAALAVAPPERLLFTSSTGAFPQRDGRWVDETSPAAPPPGSTGAVLREAEEVALASGVATIVLRLGGIYGPGRMRLIEQVRGGAVAVPSTARFVNRIHRDDCAGAIAHLLGLAAPEALYLGVDDDPADLRQVLAWLAERLGVALPAPSDDGDAGHKRCKNGRLRASGYALRYPSFRDGYAALLDRLAAGEVAR